MKMVALPAMEQGLHGVHLFHQRHLYLIVPSYLSQFTADRLDDLERRKRDGCSF